ncbi:MAG TPA: phosphoribosylformylglycinamidine synthase subunit PurQ, partial [bacterium]|nr:phosphoribosylformylglycinamidine synthase subunit PurQ [bacterium]
PGDPRDVYKKQVATLTHNDSAKYEDRWVRIKANPTNKSPFLRAIDSFDVAIRHGEGKFVAHRHFLREIRNDDLIAFQYVDKNGEPTRNYPENPNGSDLAIAGITNSRGNVLGLMPHPEVFINGTQHPEWTRKGTGGEKGMGLQIFVNAVNFVKEEL